MSATSYKVGQKVRSTVDAQGLHKGSMYVVVRVEENPTMFGNFVTYYVSEEGPGAMGGVLRVGNGHLVLSPVRS